MGLSQVPLTKITVKMKTNGENITKLSTRVRLILLKAITLTFINCTETTSNNRMHYL